MESHLRINFIDFFLKTQWRTLKISDEWGICQNIGDYLVKIQSIKYIDEHWYLSEKSYFLSI